MVTSLRQPAPDARSSGSRCTSSAPSAGCSRPRSSCGTYPVQLTFVPWDSSCPTRTSTTFFKIDSGPNGVALPRRGRARSTRSSRRAPRTTRPAPTRPSRSKLEPRRRRPEPDAAQRHDAARLLGDAGAASPTARRRRSRPRGSPTPAGRGHGARAPRPARPRAGSAASIAGAGAGTRPLHAPGSVYLAGPYKGAPLSLAGRHPGGLRPL